jgi:hypothetical protein
VEGNAFCPSIPACIRVHPCLPRYEQTRKKVREFLIGQNWFGTAVPEEIEGRVKDCRTDPRLRAYINLRPPAEEPLAKAGAEVNPKEIIPWVSSIEAQRNRIAARYTGPSVKTLPPASARKERVR